MDDDNDQKVDDATKLIDKNTKNNINPNYMPPDPLSNFQNLIPNSNAEDYIINTSPASGIKSVNHVNSAIDPKFFKDKKVLEEFDLENDVYKRELGNKIEERLIKLTPGNKVCKRIGIILVSSIIVLIFLIVYALCVNFIYIIFIFIPILTFIVTLFFTSCLTINPPNNALVLTYYGKYLGTCKENGFFWVKACATVNKISLKSNQFNGTKIKVNDKRGSPVKLGLVAVWKVRDTAKVTFGVNDYKQFVQTQAESAVRFVGCKYPYESENENEPCLKAGSEEINQILKLELERRVKIAGIEIEDARITEVTYGDEVAIAMLEKQTSEIKVMAKEKIALGAVDVIERSVKEIERRNVCKLKNEEKQRLVSNMMMVLNSNSNNGNTMIKLNI